MRRRACCAELIKYYILSLRLFNGKTGLCFHENAQASFLKLEESKHFHENAQSFLKLEGANISEKVTFHKTDSPAFLGCLSDASSPKEYILTYKYD